jgi:serine/threonine-protein kinase
MSLNRGSKLGSYEILGLLGAGGMGEVYRARDTRLRRDVAIKVLLDAKPDLLARFTREAEVLATLNHPNIAAIYGVEEDALVMELVEGETLATIIRRGSMPLDTALDYAGQIAAALEAAHEKGIVHRYLKPANIKVTPERRVKVLDFGLAAVAQSPGSNSADLTNSPTLTISPTRAGVILGTAAYMSPEQARGSPVDKRADIWAFGVVLYEILTGRPAFKGQTVTDILASLMRDEADLEAVPAQVRTAVGRCLSKDPRNRWGSIGDVRWALEAQTAPAPSRSRLRSAGWIAAAALTLVAAATTLAWLHPPPAPPHTVTRSAMNMADDFLNPVLSRDGTRLAYQKFPGKSLWLRMMDQLEGNAIPGSDRGESPAFSPDGQWLVYVKHSNPFQLMKIPVTGGTPVTLCETSAGGKLG